MFASPSFFAAVRKFKVIFQDETPVRGTLFAQLDFRALLSTAWIARKPSSLQAHLLQSCEALVGQHWDFPRPTQPELVDVSPSGDEALWRRAVKAQNRYRHQQHQHFHAAFGVFLDARLSDASPILQSCLGRADLNGFWGGFLDFCRARGRAVYPS